MIEQIVLQNFLSFKDETTFDFTATMEKPRKGYEFMKWFEEINRKKILKFQFLFGNNATGKSNFIVALTALKKIVCKRRTSKTASEEKLPESYFKLSSDTLEKPSIIRITFHIADIRYTYHISFCDNTILYESLSKQSGSRKPIEIYTREFNKEKDLVEITFPSRVISNIAQNVICQNVIKNASVISVYDEKNFESQDLRDVYNYFDNIAIFYDYDDISLASMFSNRKDKDDLRQIILPLLSDLGSNIIDYEINSFKVKMDENEAKFFRQAMGEDEFNKQFPNSERKIQILRFAHPAKTTLGVGWLTESEESVGTLNMIRLIIMLYDACKRNSPIAIDECATGIHQQTFGRIIQFFLATSKNLQVFMTSQQVSIMEMDGFRRDTVKFFDKDRKTGVTTCVRINLRKYHKNLSIVNAYFNHSFGCLPQFPDMETWKAHLANYRKQMQQSSDL